MADQSNKSNKYLIQYLPHSASLEFVCYRRVAVNVLGEHSSSQTVASIVGFLDGIGKVAVLYNALDWAKDLEKQSRVAIPSKSLYFLKGYLYTLCNCRLWYHWCK